MYSLVSTVACLAFASWAFVARRLRVAFLVVVVLPDQPHPEPPLDPLHGAAAGLGLCCLYGVYTHTGHSGVSCVSALMVYVLLVVYIACLYFYLMAVLKIISVNNN